MADPFIGEIRMFGGGFAPRAWALCDGQLLAISSNDALFSLLGTIYGGDGRTTFGLPDLRGRLPIHAGNGPGLTPRTLGSRSGSENETIVDNTMTSHTHAVSASKEDVSETNPAGNVTASGASFQVYRNVDGPPPTLGLMNTLAVGNQGNTQHHTNLMPFECVNFIISLFGVYPSRS